MKYCCVRCGYQTDNPSEVTVFQETTKSREVCRACLKSFIMEELRDARKALKKTVWGPQNEI